MVAYSLNDNIRIRLKHPIGRLITGSPKKTMRFLKNFIVNQNLKKIIIVGDFVSKNALKFDINADLYVIDNKTMRKKSKKINFGNNNILRVRNPPGSLTIEACNAIKETLKNENKTIILVDGEEDLLVLPIIKYTPTNSLVVYGQPFVGIVLVMVTGKKREEINSLLSFIEFSES